MLKLGVVGAGYWGPNLIRNFMAAEGCRVEYICDSNPERLEKIRESKVQTKLTVDPDEVIRADLDAVVVVTTAETHYTLVKKALEAGKDVFVEKPLTLSVPDGEKLVELADAKKRVLMVGHILLYHPAVRMLKRLIGQDELGDIYYVYAARLNLGRVRKDENALWCLGPHDVSVILHLLGSVPDSAQATGECFLREDIYDVVFLSLHFPNGSLAHVHVSWLDPHKTRKLTVVGSKKMVVFDDVSSTEKIKIYDKGVDFKPAYASYPESLTLRIGDIHVPKVDGKEPLRLECEHFLECVDKRTQPLSDGKNGVQVLRVLDAAQRSLEAGGKPVRP